MATIQKREGKKGPSYRVMVRMKGFPMQVKTFKRLTDAKQWAQDTESGIRKGEVKNVVRTAATKTLQDVIDRFRKEVFIHRAESTKRAEGSFLAYWEKALGSYALAYITADMVSEKMAELAAAGDGRRKADEDAEADKPKAAPKPKSRKTLKHYRDTLAVLFKYAIQWGWTASSPLDGVNRITKIRNERTRYLSDEERKRLLDACKASDNEHLYPVVVFALSTGARKSEILGLTLDDLDLTRDTAILRDTKNGDTRAVPVVHHLRDLLEDQVETVNRFYDELEPPADTRWLFPRRDGQEPIDIRKAWENARDAAKINDFRFHDLRHSTASYLAMNGASLVEIAEILGHRTLQMVRRYAHLSESHVKGVVRELNEKMF
ncbi:tyrosine-type recombinase/integrase [Polymorphum gilvum]|uniref:Integrase family protein n=1 Tax=Polymorphum gilvum (strain LMG 25793 / CGMCC 1.9160 / SL003B-26A1) TaxID=991905 RepID=F2IUP0_POLGS|nr:site-specific integrase [Polymorphum gilvum]ADZ69094.1 Integrase family protein [Polymorphum gilvum SL003B-26A1]